MPNTTMRNRWILWVNLSWLALSLGLVPLVIGQTVAPEPARVAAPVEHPTLTAGSRHPAVAELQAALRLLGYYAGAIDGVYGQTTIAAATRFQQAAGLTPDGIIGNASWERLFPALPPAASPAPRPATSSNPAPDSTTVSLPNLRLGMRGAAVMGLQDRLRTLGLFDGAIDGVFGPATQTAVKAAQSKFKLDADGVVGPTTWSVLLKEK